MPSLRTNTNGHTHLCRFALVAAWAGVSGGCVFDLPPLDRKDGGPVPPIVTTIPVPTVPAQLPEAGEDVVTPVPIPDARSEGGSPIGAPDGRVLESGVDAQVEVDSAPEAGVKPPPCPQQKQCGDRCIPLGTPCCEDGCDLPNAELAECVADGLCAVRQCVAGFVDCDGQWPNGCERGFEFASAPESPSGFARDTPEMALGRLPAAFAATWDQEEAWAGIPRTRIAEACQGCQPAADGVPLQAVEFRNQPPLADDLLAGFAMQWDGSAIYLRVEVFDDDWVGPGLGADTALTQDNVEFLFDGVPGMTAGDDQLMWIGLVEGSQAWDDREGTLFEGAQFRYAPLASDSQCRILTARLDIIFLQDNTNGAVPMSPGAQFDFNVGINDFDRVGMDAGAVAQREHHIFYKDPRNDYWFGLQRNLPPLRLTQPAPMPPAPGL